MHKPLEKWSPHNIGDNSTETKVDKRRLGKNFGKTFFQLLFDFVKTYFECVKVNKAKLLFLKRDLLGDLLDKEDPRTQLNWIFNLQLIRDK